MEGSEVVAAAGDGLWFWHDLLAQVARLARGWRLGRVAPSFAPALGRRQPAGLEPGRGGLLFGSRSKGAKNRPESVDRGRTGTKRHLVVERGGLPLATVLSAANVHGSKRLEEALDAVLPIVGPCGRPRRRVKKLHVDKGYDYAHCRAALRANSIQAHITQRGQDSSQRLGRHRWVVEPTLA